MSQQILEIAVATPLRRVFDYYPAGHQSYQPGQRVRVPFGKRQMVGIVNRIKTTSDFSELKTIDDCLDETPILSTHLMSFLQWISQYYQHSLGDVLLSALPKLLRQGRAVEDFYLNDNPLPAVCDAPVTLTEEQHSVVGQVAEDLERFKVFLLQGVTGSGKTEVYLQCIHRVLENQKSALVLVPEISLTPQTVERFRRRFQVPIIAWHSGLTDKQRAQAWVQAKQLKGGIVIGTRSALFSPLDHLGLIVMDEAHDASFKQQSGLRYSARDCAVKRASMLNIPIILGSATPSLESLLNVDSEKYHLLKLTQRVGQAKPPMINTIDLRGQQLQFGLSPLLLQEIQRHVEQGNQALLFLNRRGYAPILMCHQCGWIAQCSRCDARYTLHHNPSQLICHHCGKEQPVFKQCQECQHSELGDVGVGTEKLERGLQERFPQHCVIRIDRDTTRKKGAMQDLLKQVHDEEANILVGTQMLSKGHHFPKLSLVAIVDADTGLFSADFRGMERMAQLIIQVAGRAGRAETPGQVYIQTHHPEHPQLQALLQKGYGEFAKQLLQERSHLSLPPYQYLTLIRAESVNKQHALEFLKAARQQAQKIKNPPDLLGPIPAPMEKRAGKYRAQLLLRSSNRQALQAFVSVYLQQLDQLKLARKVRWSVDVDPVEMF